MSEYKTVFKANPGEKLVGFMEYRGLMVIATTDGVYAAKPDSNNKEIEVEDLKCQALLV